MHDLEICNGKKPAFIDMILNLMLLLLAAKHCGWFCLSLKKWIDVSPLNPQTMGESPTSGRISKAETVPWLENGDIVWQDAIVTCQDDDIFWDSPRYMGSALIGHCAYQFPIIFIRLISMKVVSNLIPAWFFWSNGHDLSPRQYVSTVLLVPRLLVSESKEKVTKNPVGKGSWNILDSYDVPWCSMHGYSWWATLPDEFLQPNWRRM